MKIEMTQETKIAARKFHLLQGLGVDASVAMAVMDARGEWPADDVQAELVSTSAAPVIKVKGKSGQERDKEKKVKTGGVAYNGTMTVEQALELFSFLLERSDSTITQALYSYGFGADAQAAVGYQPPGSVEWKEGVTPPEYTWTDEDVEAYKAAVTEYDDQARKGGGGPNTQALKASLMTAKAFEIDFDSALAMAAKKGVKHSNDVELARALWDKLAD